MEKSEGQLLRGNTMLPREDAPTYSDLGTNKMQASREQLVKKAFDEDGVLDICAELIDKDQIPTFSYFLRLAKQHTAIKFAVRRLAVHVAQVGGVLVVAKSKVKHGEWLGWLAENCSEITDRTARRYMATYDKGAKLPDWTLMSDLTPMQAYKALGIVRDADRKSVV